MTSLATSPRRRPVTTRPRPLTADGLTAWTVIADHTGLSERQVRRIYERALTKVRAECARLNVSFDDMRRHFAAHDVGVGLDLPAALIPDDDTLRDVEIDDVDV